MQEEKFQEEIIEIIEILKRFRNWAEHIDKYLTELDRERSTILNTISEMRDRIIKLEGI